MLLAEELAQIVVALWLLPRCKSAGELSVTLQLGVSQAFEEYRIDPMHVLEVFQQIKLLRLNRFHWFEERIPILAAVRLKGVPIDELPIQDMEDLGDMRGIEQIPRPEQPGAFFRLEGWFQTANANQDKGQASHSNSVPRGNRRCYRLLNLIRCHYP